MQTTDTDATQKFLDDTKQRGDQDRTYEGIEYSVDGEDGTAFGIIDQFLVAGDEKTFKDAVDVSEGELARVLGRTVLEIRG